MDQPLGSCSGMPPSGKDVVDGLQRQVPVVWDRRLR